MVKTPAARPSNASSSVTKKKVSVTAKRQGREVVTVTEEVKVFVSDTDLYTLVKEDLVRVHQHGSGKYKGHYWYLRRAGGRKDRRPVVASGRPQKLKEYLQGLGIHLCEICRCVAIGDACGVCGGK